MACRSLRQTQLWDGQVSLLLPDWQSVVLRMIGKKANWMKAAAVFQLFFEKDRGKD
jgi:hypothetical protein